MSVCLFFVGLSIAAFFFLPFSISIFSNLPRSKAAEQRERNKKRRASNDLILSVEGTGGWDGRGVIRRFF